MKPIAIIRAVVPFSVSALILFVLFVKVDMHRVLSTLQSCAPGLVMIAVLISLSVNIFVGALKWRRILSVLGCSLPYREVVAIRTGCIPFKVLFPLKSSELLKALYLDRTGRIGFLPAVSSLMVDKALNLLILFGLASSGLLYVGSGLLSLSLGGVLIVLLWFLFSSHCREMVVGMSSRIHSRLGEMVSALFSGFTALSRKDIGILGAYSLLYQLSEFGNTYLLLKAVGVTLPLGALLVFVPVIMIINNLPITVLGLGTREAAMIFFFSRWGSPAALLSGSILVTLVEHILPVLAGFLFIHYFIHYFAMKKDLVALKMEQK